MAALVGAAVALGSSSPAGATMLSPTPYMGWNTYYGLTTGLNEPAVISAADTLIARGLTRAGYRMIWIDFGWASGQRDSSGNVLINPYQWPHGLAWLTNYLHQRRLLAGIYTDAGASGCGGQGVGSLGHYQQDADAFAAWGFDAVKVDFCGAGQAALNPQTLNKQFAASVAHNASHRPMLFAVANLWEPGEINGVRPSFAASAYNNYKWARQIAQAWRTDTDIAAPNKFRFWNVLRNLDADAAHPKAAGPGHWNDPDALGAGAGLTDSQARAQLSMWAILAAPLILGSNPQSLSGAEVAMLENRRVLAVDQDRLGVQGTMIRHKGAAQVWVKRLAGGARAVALFNRGVRRTRIATSASAVGLPHARYYWRRDLWTGHVTATHGSISAVVAPQSALLYVVSRPAK